MGKRSLSFDVLKGIAILLVVLGHVCIQLMPDGTALPLHRLIYSVHMPLFVFISGYFAYKGVDGSLQMGGGVFSIM